MDSVEHLLTSKVMLHLEWVDFIVELNIFLDGKFHTFHTYTPTVLCGWQIPSLK